MSVINEIGNRYGKLTVLGRSSKRGKGQAHWVCKCDCGSFSIVWGANLRTGSTIACGCMIGKNHGLMHGEASFNALYTRYKVNAARRELVFEITKEEFKNITKKECIYCGIEPLQEIIGNKCNGEYIYNGVDRVNNDKGYTLDNIVPCCKHCNRAKRMMSSKDFLSLVERISEHQYCI